MDGQLFRPGSKVLVRGRWSSGLPSPGPYTVRSLQPLHHQGSKRKSTRLCRFRDGMFRVELETGSGIILKQKFRPKHLEPIVDLAADTRLQHARLATEDPLKGHSVCNPYATCNLLDVEILLSEDEDDEEKHVHLMKRSAASNFSLRTLKSQKEHIVALMLGPHRITDAQLTVLESGVGELADSILDAFCYATSRSTSIPCIKNGRVELVSSLSLACMLSAAQTSGRSLSSSSHLRLKHMWQRWANRKLVLGPYLLQAGSVEPSNHWILLAFSVRTHEFWILDSLDQRSKFTNLIRKLLKGCSSLLCNDSSPWQEQTTDHNLQTDDESCGLFVLEFIRCILQNNGKIPPSIRVDTEEARSYVLNFLLENAESRNSQRSSDVEILD